MSKIKSAAGSQAVIEVVQQTAPTQLVEPEHLGFLASLSTLATPVTDLTKLVSKDPLVRTRGKFVANVEESIKQINAFNVSVATILRRVSDGTYQIQGVYQQSEDSSSRIGYQTIRYRDYVAQLLATK